MELVALLTAMMNDTQANKGWCAHEMGKSISSFEKYVHDGKIPEGIHDQFVAAMVERLKGLAVDNALKSGTHIGPVVDQSQLNQDLYYIDEGKKGGAKLAFGGNLLKWIDETGWMAASLDFPGHQFVTVALDRVEFRQGAQGGNGQIHRERVRFLG